MNIVDRLHKRIQDFEQIEKLGYAFQTEKEWKDYRKSQLEKEGKECLWN